MKNKLLFTLVFLIAFFFIISPVFANQERYEVIDSDGYALEDYILNETSDIDGDDITDIIVSVYSEEQDDPETIYVFLGKYTENQTLDLSMADYASPAKNTTDNNVVSGKNITPKQTVTVGVHVGASKDLDCSLNPNPKTMPNTLLIALAGFTLIILCLLRQRAESRKLKAQSSKLTSFFNISNTLG